MKAGQILFITAQGWWRFADGQASQIEPWLQLQGTALVVVDFADSAIGLQYCKGKKAYAAAQIEKTIRSEGSIDGSVQVLVHQQAGAADSSQTLYTAVPLALWQEFQLWAARQLDHCFIVPLAALLIGKRHDERPIVLRAGPQLHAFGQFEGKLYYAAATAIGTEIADFTVAARTLATQLRLAGWRSANSTWRWACLSTESLASEQELVRQLNQADLINAELQPHDSFNVDAKRQLITALPGLLSQVSARSFATSALARAAWLGEKYLLPIVAVVAVAALALGLFAWSAQRMAQAQRQSMQTTQSELQLLQERVAKVSGAVDVAQTPTAAFARQMGFAVIYDPVRMLATLRRASGDQVRIQRLQLVDTNSSKPTRFRVDGVVSSASPHELSRFLNVLRSAGWQAESTAPFDNSAGAFAYYLKFVAPQVPTESERR